MSIPQIAVIGSVNLDIVATAERLPRAGETVTGAALNRFPGGKGANQALAARRLGAEVALLAAVGDDTAADEALRLLREGDVNLSGCRAVTGQPTGTALIAVADSGENQIVVAPGANRSLALNVHELPPADAVLAQLEVPVDTLLSVCSSVDAFVCLNLAPAITVPDALVHAADLVVVNEVEAQFYGAALHRGARRVAVTHGAATAVLYENGHEIASATPPSIEAVDTTGAGDTFTAALTVALVEGAPPDAALRFACAAGALAATKPGAQPSLPSRAEVEALLRV